LSTSLYAAAEIQFVKGLEEKVIPDIKLTRARDGSSGIATFKFKNPNVFDASTASAGDVTGMFLVDSEGEFENWPIKFLNRNFVRRRLPAKSNSVPFWLNSLNYHFLISLIFQFVKLNMSKSILLLQTI